MKVPTAARLHHPPWDAPLFPFDEPSAGLLIGDVPLAALQQRVCASLGLALLEHDARDPLPDHCQVAFTSGAVFSAAALRALLHDLGGGRGSDRGALAQAAIAPGTPLSRAVSRMRGEAALRVPLWAGALAGRRAQLQGAPGDALGAASLRAVCDEDGARRERVPPHGRPPHQVEIPCVQRLCGEVGHWLDALELSLAALHCRRLELGLTAGQGGQGKNQLGRKVEVHPTAYVAGSILQDGVRVEPHASVVDSYVGEGALIADHSVISGCVIGAACRTLVDTSLRRVVAQPGSTLSNLGLSDVIIGRDVFLTTAVSVYGPPPGQDVVVEGRDTNRALLGGAFGARAILGARALLGAGLALPPGVLIVSRPEEAAAKLDEAGLARATMRLGERASSY